MAKGTNDNGAFFEKLSEINLQICELQSFCTTKIGELVEAGELEEEGLIKSEIEFLSNLRVADFMQLSVQSFSSSPIAQSIFRKTSKRAKKAKKLPLLQRIATRIKNRINRSLQAIINEIKSLMASAKSVGVKITGFSIQGIIPWGLSITINFDFITSSTST